MLYNKEKDGTEMSARSKGKWQGMNWIRQDKRLAIYLRDGLACAYCGSSVEEGTQLTLDHIVPHCKGGSNKEDNLITSCHKCNSTRGSRDVYEFALAVAQYIGRNANEIMDFIEKKRNVSLGSFRIQAKEIIFNRKKEVEMLPTENPTQQR